MCFVIKNINYSQYNRLFQNEDLIFLYIQKQLKPIADAVLLFFDQSFTEVMGGRQMTLF